MSDKVAKPRQITIYYQKSDHYRLSPATGVHGGPVPSGDIMAEFFVERQTPPEKIILEIGDSKPREIKREGAKFVREIQMGVLLRPDVAHTVGKWLMAKAAQAGFSEIKK